MFQAHGGPNKDHLPPPCSGSAELLNLRNWITPDPQAIPCLLFFSPFFSFYFLRGFSRNLGANSSRGNKQVQSSRSNLKGGRSYHRIDDPLKSTSAQPLPYAPAIWLGLARQVHILMPVPVPTSLDWMNGVSRPNPTVPSRGTIRQGNVAKVINLAADQLARPTNKEGNKG